jgi:N-hydroxyarylamine O-acetyltransferase
VPPDTEKIGLDAYCARIGYRGERSPTLGVFQALHRAHVLTIPFENLDILLGRPIALDLESLQAKLVANRRGGYCFEHNLLFTAGLESLGFRVTRLAARVRMGASAPGPRNHMVFTVDIAGESWLGDVGFGRSGLLDPIRLRPQGPVGQGVWTFQMKNEGDEHLLQTLQPDGWLDLYAFTMEPQVLIDYVVASHYTSTHPESHFTQMLIVQQCGLEAGQSLVNREFSIHKPGEQIKRTLPDEDALLTTLLDTFGMQFSKGTRFRCPRRNDHL